MLFGEVNSVFFLGKKNRRYPESCGQLQGQFCGEEVGGDQAEDPVRRPQDDGGPSDHRAGVPRMV